MQFSLDGQTIVFPYTWQTMTNGFPLHIFMAVVFALSCAYIVGYNLCCPPMIMLCQVDPIVPVRCRCDHAGPKR